MTIMIVSRGFPTEKYSTNGIFEYDQAKALVKAGCKVIFAVMDMRSIRRKRKYGFSSFEVDGVSVRIVSVPLGNVPKNIFYKISQMALSSLYKRIFEKFGAPDIIHAHFTDQAYAAAKLKAVGNIPFVVTEHSSLMNKDEPDKALKKAADFAYHKADTVIAVSSALGAKLEKCFACQTICIPNMVDTNMFCYEERKSDGKFRFLASGNLIPLKRMSLTIEAFAKAFANREQVELVIFGGGYLQKELEEQIKNLNLEKRITLKGRRPREEISKELHRTDCFVLASATETFGVVYIEAMASGVPVIATRCGGPEAYINDSNGIMINIDDLQGLTNAMLSVYSQPDRYDRRQIAKWAASEFSSEAVAALLIKEYNKLNKKLDEKSAVEMRR